MTVPLDSESKYELFIQSWASQIALDIFFLSFSKYHSIVPVHHCTVLRGHADI